MKKKQLTYLLLPVVIGIWGYIFYKFFNDTNQPSTNYEIVDQKPFVAFKDSTEYTFKLIKKYRDPFLGSFGYTGSKSISKKKPEPILKPITPIIFPPIVYNGIVTSHENKKKIGLLVINGQSHMIQTNDIIDDILVKGIFKDSVVVQLQSVQKAFRKHK